MDLDHVWGLSLAPTEVGPGIDIPHIPSPTQEDVDHCEAPMIELLATSSKVLCY